MIALHFGPSVSMLLSKMHEVDAVRFFFKISSASVTHRCPLSLILATLQSYQLCFYLTHNESCIAKRLSVAADVIGMSAVTAEKWNDGSSLVFCPLRGWGGYLVYWVATLIISIHPSIYPSNFSTNLIICNHTDQINFEKNDDISITFPNLSVITEICESLYLIALNCSL